MLRHSGNAGQRSMKYPYGAAVFRDSGGQGDPREQYKNWKQVKEWSHPPLFLAP